VYILVSDIKVTEVELCLRESWRWRLVERIGLARWWGWEVLGYEPRVGVQVVFGIGCFPCSDSVVEASCELTFANYAVVADEEANVIVHQGR